MTHILSCGIEHHPEEFLNYSSDPRGRDFRRRCGGGDREVVFEKGVLPSSWQSLPPIRAV
jgi:hypothetical protein